MKIPGTKTVKEAAVALGTSDSRILEMIAEKKLEAINTSKGSLRPRWAIPDEQITALSKPKVALVKPQKQHI